MPELLTYPFSDAGVAAALEALGTTPTAVAANLSALGFKGTPMLCQVCPVAQYLKKVVTDAEVANVGQEYVTVDRTVIDGTNFDAERVRADTPEAVSRFIDMFDLDAYPELVAR